MNTLQFAADSPWWVHVGAAMILFLHVAGGTAAMLSGVIALALRRGSRGHRIAGNVFFVSMLFMAAIGAAVSPFLTSPDGDGRWFDAIAAVLALYLVATAWATARRKAGTYGLFEVGALLFAAASACAVVLIGREAASRPTGTLGGYDAGGYYAFAALFALAAALDLNTIARGGATGVRRIARHVWRICLSLIIALSAFFFGQQQLMPEFAQGSPLLAIPTLATLALMLFWLVKLRTGKLLAGLSRSRRLRHRGGRAATLPS